MSMKTSERIFQVLIFEVVAIILLTLAGKLVSNQPTSSVGLLAILISITAMFWNYVFNILFDKWFGSNRIKRSMKTRVLHTTLFEVGMLVFSLPLIMWGLKIGFVEALIYDIGAMIFFLVYVFVFNWCYDHIRHFLIEK